MEKNIRSICLVIHTLQRALRLKEILEAHGIDVILEDVDLQNESASIQAKQIVIDIDNLTTALKILESGDLVSSPFSMPRMDGGGNTLLIPVDFSPSSMLAVKVGFYLAKKLDLEPVILHAYLTPQFTPTDYYENQIDPIELPEVTEIEEEIDLKNIASSQLSKFKKQVNIAIGERKVVNVKFSTTLLEGVAEQVINEYCRQNKPQLLVMSTRGVDRKESDLVGSVTAEVIDSCRVPILTVPDNYMPREVEGIKKIALFCTFTPFDAVTVRALMRMFNYPQCEVWLIPANESNLSRQDARLDKLNSYLSETYPTAVFHSHKREKGKFDDNMRDFLDENKIDMIIVPNKKSNAISRFFHPTLAHKILFERDIPLLVLPV